MTQKKIIVYSLSTCIHCRDTVRYIADKGLKPSFFDVDLLEIEQRKKVLADLKDVNPQQTFPTTVIGEKVIIGFEPEEIEEALKKG